tara:strand:- start:423 stop:530 length:108 start_codon:yes stop_codon:yes gene_type:complete
MKRIKIFIWWCINYPEIILLKFKTILKPKEDEKGV